jgi:hypothetical protein
VKRIDVEKRLRHLSLEHGDWLSFQQVATRAWMTLGDYAEEAAVYSDAMDQFGEELNKEAGLIDWHALRSGSAGLAMGLLSGNVGVLLADERCTGRLCQQLDQIGVTVKPVEATLVLAGLSIVPLTNRVLAAIAPNPGKPFFEAKRELLVS